jgi:hypothetical protein
LRIEARPVVHTNHAAYAYRIRAEGHAVIWAPEFYRFPHLARLDLGRVLRRSARGFLSSPRPTLRSDYFLQLVFPTIFSA